MKIFLLFVSDSLKAICNSYFITKNLCILSLIELLSLRDFPLDFFAENFIRPSFFLLIPATWIAGRLYGRILPSFTVLCSCAQDFSE